MYILISLSLLVITTIALVGLRVSRSSQSYFWLTAALGSFFVWISILFWQMDMPRRFFPSVWAPTNLFNYSPEFLTDPYAWIYAISLAALAAAVILTAPARAAIAVNPAAWAGTLALSILGMLAVLADNPLTLVLCWTAIDLTEFFNTLRASDSPSLSERTVVSFATRAAGSGIALWASVVSSASGKAFFFENASSQTAIILLIAVGLRLGVLPLHLAFRSEPVLRRGFGTFLRLMTAASSLVLLARLPVSLLGSQIQTGTVSQPAQLIFLFLLIALAAVYGGWKWFFATNEINGRPYWIIGMSALSLAAHLRGSSTGSAAWGIAMILFGGISFLYSTKNRVISRVLSGLSIFLLALPFTLTSTGWSGSFPLPFLFWPIFIIAHLLLVGGYIRHLFQPGESIFNELPTWAQSAYPAGLSLLAVTIVLTGFWGWAGAIQLGTWVASIALIVTGSLILLGLWRFSRLLPAKRGEVKEPDKNGGVSEPDSVSAPLPNIQMTTVPAPVPARAAGAGRLSDYFRQIDLFHPLVNLFWFIFHAVGNFLDLVNRLLEGDGGLLWTLLLLVLLISIFPVK